MIKSEDFDGKISIITAVYNAENHIQDLIESLRQQGDSNFEWVVVDGLSTDNTLEILKKIDDLNVKIISEADFGIYDASVEKRRDFVNGRERSIFLDFNVDGVIYNLIA